jgi:hypothetical protein
VIRSDQVVRPASDVLEVVLDFPTRVSPLRNVKSTVLLASIEGVRRAGRFDEYASFVPKEHRAPLFESIAGTWLSVDTAAAHYAACDALRFSALEQAVMGRSTANQVGESMVGTVSRLAQQVGATPLLYFAQFQRLWARAYDGGGIAVYRTGPKDARLELISFSLCTSVHYRNALRGWVEGLGSLFCSRLFLRELPQPHGPQSMALRAQWV